MQAGSLWRRAGTAIALWAGALVLSACGDDRFPDYRYRMTVEVETPEGLKTGSSVIEVRTKGVMTIQDASGKTFRDEFKGQAIAVDVASGKTVFALLAKPGDADYAKKVAFKALRPVRESTGNLEGYREHLTQMTQTEGAHELPSVNWPMFVQFRDINDPGSVEELSPLDLSSAFGEGFRIERILIEITNDPVDTGIEKRFPWWDKYKNRHFDGSSTILESVSYSSVSERLSSGSFSTEFSR